MGQGHLVEPARLENRLPPCIAMFAAIRPSLVVSAL